MVHRFIDDDLGKDRRGGRAIRIDPLNGYRQFQPGIDDEGEGIKRERLGIAGCQFDRDTVSRELFLRGHFDMKFPQDGQRSLADGNRNRTFAEFKRIKMFAGRGDFDFAINFRRSIPVDQPAPVKNNIMVGMMPGNGPIHRQNAEVNIETGVSLAGMLIPDAADIDVGFTGSQVINGDTDVGPEILQCLATVVKHLQDMHDLRIHRRRRG